MATISLRVDRGVESGLRSQYWESGVLNASWHQADVIDCMETLGKPARYLRIVADEDCDLKIRLNPLVTYTPMRDPDHNYPNREAPEEATTALTTSINAVYVGGSVFNAERTFILDNVLPIKQIELTVWTTGTFTVFIA